MPDFGKNLDSYMATLTGMAKRLPELRAACDQVLEAESLREHGDADFAVNWADMSCARAEIFLDDTGKCGFRVVVEEADPVNYEFSTLVSRDLAALGFEDVLVDTEW